MQAFVTILPMAFVMSAGPETVTVTFLATSREPKRSSLAFLGGVAVAVTIGARHGHGAGLPHAPG